MNTLHIKSLTKPLMESLLARMKDDPNVSVMEKNPEKMTPDLKNPMIVG